ncbi:MAG: BBP7 family outer membrane beta-barrel protein [Planctomycetia bacterium]
MRCFTHAMLGVFALACFIAISAVAGAVNASDGSEYLISDDFAIGRAGQGCLESEVSETFGAAGGYAPGGPCTCDACTKRHCPPGQPGLVQNLLACKDRCWIGRFDSLLLWRSAPSSRPLFTTFNAATKAIGPVALDANRLDSDPLAAPRISLFRPDGCGYAREVTYLYAGNFYGDRSLPPVFQGYAVASPGIYGNPWGDQPGAPPLTTVDAKLLSSLQSLEFNARTPFLWDMAQFLFGFRWVQWQEQLTMAEQFSDADFPSIRGSGLYDTSCVNDLYGGQIGIDSLLLTTASGLRFEGLVKAGVFYNAAVQSSSYSYSYSTTPPFTFNKGIRVGQSPAGASFVGEVGLTGVIPFRRNWDFRFGYFGLWIEGIAQQSNQLSGQDLTQPEIVPATGSLTAAGGVLVHGLSLGLEGRW